ncbi:MAG: penicillin binding protein PBP4B [Synergistaceae bacterium]|nr:penicillin binding protein PBP4B [Synergistaceae bacterium]
MRKFYTGLLLLLVLCSSCHANINRVSNIPNYQWQKVANFPDWLGRVDDTLAINNMTGFYFYHGQGQIYMTVSKQVKNFNLFINGVRFNTSECNNGGNFLIDFSNTARDGVNNIQVSNIVPSDLKNAVKIFVPYPVILDGNINESGINPKTLELISDIISCDVAHGFPSAQLAIIRNGRLVYANSWGKINSYNQDGTRKNSPDTNINTLYDLASVTKMFTINYAVQKLVSEGKLNIDSRIIDILGRDFADKTIRINYAGYNIPDINTLKKWKSLITVRDVLCHQAGFPADTQYHNKNFDAAKQEYNPNANNILYAGDRESGLKAIYKTPLMYKPGSKTLYSDVDYILMTFIIEKITGTKLDIYLQKNFWRPMGLTRIAYNPLKNGFNANDCAATELIGNTYGNNINFPGIRKYTLQGEVHDGKAFYVMAGVAGHAGLFANAVDIAKLASVMLTGGYGSNKFFPRNIIDSFTAPKNFNDSHWGIGWYRQGEDKRVYYFGSDSQTNTIGHQGWTGTLVMIDPVKNLVIAYLTNKINSPVLKPFNKRKIFTGNYFTAATLGFVPQLIYMGLDNDNNNISERLALTLADMAQESIKLIPQNAASNHPYIINAKSKIFLLRDYNNRGKTGIINQYLPIIEKSFTEKLSRKK